VLPPGPRLPAAAQTALFARDPIGFLDRCAARHGACFTVKLLVFGTLVYVIDDRAAREVLMGDPAVFRAGDAYRVMEPVVGSTSILRVDGADHLRIRRIMSGAFRAEVAARHRPRIGAIAAAALAGWPVGQRFRLRPEMQRIALRIILEVLFGIDDAHRVAAIEGHVDQLRSHGNLFMLLSQLRVELGGLSPWGRVKRRLDAIDELLRDEIARRRAGADGGADALSHLIDGRDDRGAALDDRTVRDQLVSLIFAGHETTATSLTWLFERLLRHPAALARATAAAAGGDDAYLEAAVCETLRLRPVLPDASRRLAVPARVMGFDLPAGVTVVVPFTHVHRLAALHPDPDRFRPERFLDGPPDGRGWMPFGGGTRRCLGAQFAVAEMVAVAAAVLAGARLRAARSAGERQVLEGITLVPERGGEVVVDAHLAAAPVLESPLPAVEV